jgi:hypothetical protein
VIAVAENHVVMHSTTPVQINPSTRHRAVSLRSSIVNVKPCTN